MSWQQVVAAAELDESSPTACTVGGVPIALYRVGDKVCATSNLCTHGQALLSDGYQEGGEIECPLHQGRFDIATGKALCAPLIQDLRTYPAEVRDGSVWVDMS
jgi:nitrite reductase/ring-hydroxylating ferredoxin subunit